MYIIFIIEYFLYFRAVICLDSLASCVLITSLLEQSIINWIFLFCFVVVDFYFYSLYLGFFSSFFLSFFNLSDHH